MVAADYILCCFNCPADITLGKMQHAGSLPDVPTLDAADEGPASNSSGPLG